MLFSTLFTITSTRQVTATDISRVTPTSTITITVAPGSLDQKRDLVYHGRRVARQAKIDEVFDVFRRQNAPASRATGSAAAAALSSAFSSACSCQNYAGQTITETYTNALEVR